MRSFLSRALPFCLALFVGIALASAVGHKTSKTRCWKSCHRSSASHHFVSETPLRIEAVPDRDFSEAPARSGHASGSLRLIALFDADGTVKDVRPFPMLPYGVPESEAGRGQYADVTSMMKDGHFVKHLPGRCTESAIDHVRGIRFRPRLVNGQPVSEWVKVNTDFDYYEPPIIRNCSTTQVTVMDDSGTLWQHSWGLGRPGCLIVY